MDEIFGDSDRQPDEDDIRNMVYLERCIKEALRLCPSVPLFARRLSEDVTLGKHLYITSREKSLSKKRKG